MQLLTSFNKFQRRRRSPGVVLTKQCSLYPETDSRLSSFCLTNFHKSFRIDVRLANASLLGRINLLCRAACCSPVKTLCSLSLARLLIAKRSGRLGAASLAASAEILARLLSSESSPNRRRLIEKRRSATAPAFSFLPPRRSARREMLAQNFSAPLSNHD